MTNGTDPKDYASSSITQVITLASAILGVSITFAKNFSSNHVPGLLLCSWVLYVLAILAGILCLSALTGLAMRDKSSIENGPLRWLWLIELGTFFVATVCLMVTALQVY